MRYKVVELSIVAEDSIEKELNFWTGQGWQFDSIHFVVRENSRRPAMAFLFFAQEGEDVRELPSKRQKNRHNDGGSIEEQDHE